MALYYFDIIETNKAFKDDVGSECTSYAEMRAVALRTICELAAQTRWGAEPPQYGIIVRDAENREVYAVNLNLVERAKLAA